MQKLFIGVDLGSTNIKVALYDETFKMLDSRGVPVEYVREGGVVEFDTWEYCADLTRLSGCGNDRCSGRWSVCKLC